MLKDLENIQRNLMLNAMEMQEIIGESDLGPYSTPRAGTRNLLGAKISKI